jgi:hypothetical protein
LFPPIHRGEASALLALCSCLASAADQGRRPVWNVPVSLHTVASPLWSQQRTCTQGRSTWVCAQHRGGGGTHLPLVGRERAQGRALVALVGDLGGRHPAAVPYYVRRAFVRPHYDLVGLLPDPTSRPFPLLHEARWGVRNRNDVNLQDRSIDRLMTTYRNGKGVEGQLPGEAWLWVIYSHHRAGQVLHAKMRGGW